MDKNHQGICCPRCGHQQFRVIRTRRVHGNVIRRRRECLLCGHRITTHERKLGE
jgi:transcriptional repressor NrdR